MTYFYALLTFIASIIAAIWYHGRATSPETAPTSPVEPEPMASTDHDSVIALEAPVAVATTKPLDTFCAALRDFEGKPGDANYRNNNPGNCRYYSGGYLPKYGNVKRSPSGFAIFPTYALGWEYLQELVYHRVQLHPFWDFYDFFDLYAPSNDGNSPTHYADWVALHCGVKATKNLKDYFSFPSPTG